MSEELTQFERTGNPYPGLRPFETEEYNLFFGREGQSDELLARLGRTRFLAVVGTSGSGKSSLIRAGLLPALYGGLMAGTGSAWRIAVIRPGHDPLGNLAHALAEDSVLGSPEVDDAVEASIIETTLRRSTLGLVDAVRQARVPAGEHVLVVVDQFEELFRFRAVRARQGTDDEASAFVKLLLEAPRARDVSLYVVLTMRSDFLGDCAQFQGLPEAINDGQYLIPRMTRDERRMAITGPAVVGDGEMSPPLVNRLLNDVGDNPDQLPILQHALMRTWEHWSAHRSDGEPVGLDDYLAVGTMSEALSLHADEAFKELKDERSRHVAEVLFKALTERGADNREVRRPTRLREVCEITGATPEEVAAVVEVFRGEGRSFLMPPAGTPLEPETVIDISHESLIRNWERLREWVKEEAESARIYRRLAEAAAAYRAGEGGLLDDVTLGWVNRWRDKYQPNRAWGVRYHPGYDEALAYLEESRAAREAEAVERERQREEREAAKQRELELAQKSAAEQLRAAQRLRRFVAAMVVMLVLAVAATAAAAVAFNSANTERAKAEDSAKEAKEAQGRAERSAKEADEAKVTAEKSAKEARDNEAKLKLEKERVEKITLGLIEEKKRTDAALVAQRLAVARANAEKRKALIAQKEADDNLKKQEAALYRSSNTVLGAAAFQREDYAEALRSFDFALDTLKKERESHGNKDDGTSNLLDIARVLLLTNRGATERKLGEYDQSKFDAAVNSYSEAVSQMEALSKKLGAARVGDPDHVVEWTLFDVYHGSAQALRDRAAHKRGSTGGGYSLLAKGNSPSVAPKPDATPADPARDDRERAGGYFEKAVTIQESLLEPEKLLSQATATPTPWPSPRPSPWPTPGADAETDPKKVARANLARIVGVNENLARVYRDLKKHAEAEKVYGKILGIRERLKDEDEDEYVAALREVAKFNAERGECCYDKAASYYEQAGLLAEKMGPDNEKTVAETYSELGEVYAAQGKLEKAKAAFKLARVFQEVALVEKQGGTAALAGLEFYENAADAFAGMGRDEAGGLYDTALAFATVQSKGKGAPAQGRIALKRAKYYRELKAEKDYAEAEETFKSVISLNDPANGENPTKDPAALAAALRGLGGLYADELNKPAEAEPVLKRSLEVARSLPPEQNQNLFAEGASLAELARLYQRQGRGGELEGALKQRAENASKILNATHERFGKGMENFLAEGYEGFRLYATAGREYIEATGDLAAFYAARHKEGDAIAIYKAMLGDTENPDSNPATCCVQIDGLVDPHALAVFAGRLREYHQLLSSRGMSREAEEVAKYIKKVEKQREEAKELALLFLQ